MHIAHTVALRDCGFFFTPSRKNPQAMLNSCESPHKSMPGQNTHTRKEVAVEPNGTEPKGEAAGMVGTLPRAKPPASMPGEMFRGETPVAMGTEPDTGAGR